MGGQRRPSALWQADSERSPTRAAETLAAAMSANAGSRSMSTARRPLAIAATAVVPAPPNGSSTRPPSGVWIRRS
jgi:hypothetical protein